MFYPSSASKFFYKKTIHPVNFSQIFSQIVKFFVKNFVKFSVSFQLKNIRSRKYGIIYTRFLTFVCGEKTDEESWKRSSRWRFCKNYKDLEYISNFIISILFLIQHNHILSRLSSVKKSIWHQSERIASSSDTTKIQIPGCKYSLNYLNIILYSFNYLNITMWILLYILMLMIIGFCILIHPGICIFVVSDDDASCAPGVKCSFIHY